MCKKGMERQPDIQSDKLTFHRKRSRSERLQLRCHHGERQEKTSQRWHLNSPFTEVETPETILSEGMKQKRSKGKTKMGQREATRVKMATWRSRVKWKSGNEGLRNKGTIDTGRKQNHRMPGRHLILNLSRRKNEKLRPSNVSNTSGDGFLCLLSLTLDSWQKPFSQA